MKTAVEWLYEQMPKKIQPHYKKQLEQAKEMEKEERQTYKYTEEDLRRAISFGQGMDLWKEEEKIEKFIQSINETKQQEHTATKPLNNKNMKTAVEQLREEFNEELQVAIAIGNEDKVRTIKHLLNITSRYLEIEKEQHKHTFKQSRLSYVFDEEMPPVWKTFEQYYNENFKQEQ